MGRVIQRSRRVAAGEGSRVKLVGFGNFVFALSVLLGCPVSVSAEPGAYVGDATCYACHADTKAPYAKTIHARVLTPEAGRSEKMKLGCEACHGPGRAHVEAGGGKGTGMLAFRADDPENIAVENANCLSCHSGGARTHWKGSAHDSGDLACTGCHVVMENRSLRGQLREENEIETCTGCHLMQRAKTKRDAHMPVREGRLQCSSCHNTHGSVSESLLTHTSVNENCYSCHAEKRGPFLWEHAPVNENCLNCHTAHGSTRQKMLRLEPPRLCQQCHVESLHPTEARQPSNKFVIGGACNSCHSAIHGSNHPSGFAFTR